MIYVTREIQIPPSELELSYARSSGPGGQNVNKVNSKAVLRWNLAASPSLPAPARARLLARLAHRLNAAGEIIIASDRFRDQHRNREDCFEKLRQLLLAASFVPKTRKKSQPSRSSERRAREAKSRHSRKKSLRRAARHDD